MPVNRRGPRSGSRRVVSDAAAPIRHVTDVPATFFARDPVVVGPELLGKVLVRGHRRARIVEVEAYRGSGDPASHARNGPTPRSSTMFGPPGRWYVYFTYGMHWCANVVCGVDGEAAAVLLRAAEPLGGLAAMRRARPTARSDRDLCRGPARLCKAMGIDGTFDGQWATSGPLRLVDDGYEASASPLVSGRIGIRHGEELPWRWGIPASEHLSRSFPTDSRTA